MLDKSDLQAIQDMITAAIQPVNNRLDTIETRLDTIETRLDNVENKLDTIETRLDNVENRLDTMETRLDNVENRLDAMQKDISTIKSDIHFNRKTEIDIIDYIDNRIDEKVELVTNKKIQALKDELNIKVA